MYGLMTSNVPDVAREMVLIALRNGDRWYYDWLTRGADPEVHWIAMLLGANGRALRRLIRRRSRGGRMWTGSADEPSQIDNAHENGYDKSWSIQRARRIRRVRHALLQLPEQQQRVLRLSYGIFPARTQWRPQKIAGYLGRTEPCIHKLIEEGEANLTDRLRGI